MSTIRSSTPPKLELQLLRQKSVRPGVLLISLQNHYHDRELRVNIVSVRMKRHNETDFITVIGFKIIAAVEVDHTFRIDLDPNEKREYGIFLPNTNEGSFDYEIQARDQRSGVESNLLSGHYEGFDPPIGFSETPLGRMESNYPIGKTVIIKRIVTDPNLHQRLIISKETGKANDFGIFNRHEINPTAAYIALGREGYRELIGKHVIELDWDRDTMASPPDDLVAIHVTNDTTKEHGWYFRKDLMFQDE